MAYRMKTPDSIEHAVTDTYKKIENGVVGSYKKIENGVVESYKKIEEKFVNTFLEEIPDDAGTDSAEQH